MKLYLDTNILVFIRDNSANGLSGEVENAIMNYDNRLYTSSVCVMELVHLFQIGKLERKRGKNNVSAEFLLDWLDEMCITVVPVTQKHLAAFASLPLYDDHRDPNDRIVIAQAISDKVMLVSSDRKFSRYEKYGLDFMFNER